MGAFKMILRTTATFIALAMGFVATDTASAQAIDPRHVLNSLKPENSGPMVRSMRDSGTLQFNPNQMVHYLDLPTVNINVSFEQDTAFLTVQDMLSLRSVAAALKAPEIAQQRFQVASHYISTTDPVSATPVSHRRANAVMEHLVAFYEIDPSRLVAVGYGAVAASSPTSTGGSRVELINITSQ